MKTQDFEQARKTKSHKYYVKLQPRGFPLQDFERYVRPWRDAYRHIWRNCKTQVRLTLYITF